MMLIKREYGIFTRWPCDGDAWIHPEDIATLSPLIPSDRIFLSESRGVGYKELRYGSLRIRILPVLWEVVTPPEYHVGDEVEVKSLLGQNDAGTALIREVWWEHPRKCATYELEQNGMRLPRRYFAGDLQPIVFLRDEPGSPPSL